MRFILAILATVFSISAALAADVYQSTKDDPISISAGVDAPSPIWTGPYIGAAIGYGNASHEVSADVPGGNLLNLDGLAGSGGVLTLSGGFDVARERVLFGVLGGYTGSDVETSLSVFNGAFSAKLEKQDEWYLGGRAGLLVTPSTLVYVGAAYVATEYELSGTGFTSISKQYDGVKALGGVEVALGRGLSAKLEYQHDFYGDVTWLDDNGLKVTDTLDEDKVLIGIGYKFGIGEW